MWPLPKENKRKFDLPRVYVSLAVAFFFLGRHFFLGRPEIELLINALLFCAVHIWNHLKWDNNFHWHTANTTATPICTLSWWVSVVIWLRVFISCVRDSKYATFIPTFFTCSSRLGRRNNAKKKIHNTNGECRIQCWNCHWRCERAIHDRIIFTFLFSAFAFIEIKASSSAPPAQNEKPYKVF